MRGASSNDLVPSCAYYDEENGRWDSAGLAIEAMTMVSSSGAGEGGDGADDRVDVNLTCLSFHLSGFTVSADEVDAAFRTVPLVSCAGDDLFAQASPTQFREIGTPVKGARPKHCGSVQHHKVRYALTNAMWQRPTPIRLNSWWASANDDVLGNNLEEQFFPATAFRGARGVAPANDGR